MKRRGNFRAKRVHTSSGLKNAESGSGLDKLTQRAEQIMHERQIPWSMAVEAAKHDRKAGRVKAPVPSQKPAAKPPAPAKAPRSKSPTLCQSCPFTDEPYYAVFCDGGCWPNPGGGGWAAIIRSPDGAEREISGGEAQTTNQRMEISAAIAALETIPLEAPVWVTTDSMYLINGASDWIRGWKMSNWMRKTASGFEPVKNRDLWERIDAAMKGKRVAWQWVRGHAGHPENERCDVLASNARKAVGA